MLKWLNNDCRLLIVLDGIQKLMKLLTKNIFKNFFVKIKEQRSDPIRKSKKSAKILQTIFADFLI